MNDPVTMPAFAVWVLVGAPVLFAGVLALLTSKADEDYLDKPKGYASGWGIAYVLLFGALFFGAVFTVGGIGAGFYYGIKS